MHQIIIYIPAGGTRGPVTLDLISNCSSLLFGTQGRPKRRKLVFFLQARKGRHAEAFVPGKAPQGLACFQSPLFFDAAQSQGEWGCNKKGYQVVDGEMNHKLSRETQF